MKRLILRIYDYLSQHKAVAALIVALLLGAASLSLTRLNFEENISAFLPETPEVKRYNEVYSKMGIDKMAVFFEGGTLDERIEAMADFEAVWAQKDSTGIVPGFRSSTNDASEILDVLSFIGANEAYFLKDEDYERMDSLLSDKNYPDEKLKAQREAMYTAVSSRYLRTDPLGLFTPVLGRLAKLNPRSRPFGKTEPRRAEPGNRRLSLHGRCRNGHSLFRFSFRRQRVRQERRPSRPYGQRQGRDRASPS